MLHSLVFRPDDVSTAILVSDIMEGLQEHGHHISVLTTTPHYNRDKTAEKQQPLKKCLGGLYYKSDYKGINVIHIPMPRKDQKVRGRYRDYVIFHFWSLIFSIFLFGPQDIVFSPSPPLTMGVIASLIAFFKGAKAVYDVQELYPALTIQIGMMSEQDRLYKIFLLLERFVYTISHRIVVITPSFKKEIEKLGISPDKIHIIPNYVVSGFPPKKPKINAISSRYSLTEKFVIMYAGNIGLTQSFDTIITVIERTQDIADLHFLITGDGVRRQDIVEIIQKRDLKNVDILGWLPVENMPDVYATADVALVPLMAGTAKTTIPSKIYTIMANGISVLLSVDMDSDMVPMINVANCGLAVPPDDADAMEAAIREMSANREQTQIYGRNGRAYAETYFSREHVINRFNELVLDLTK